MTCYLIKSAILAATLAASAALSANTAFAEPKISVKAAPSPGLKQWGVSIGEVLKQEMDYPKRFDTAGEYGLVSFKLDVDRAGHVRTAEQIESSGYSRLDESAAATMAKMSSLPAMPQTLQAQRAIVTLRLAYLPKKSIGHFGHRRSKWEKDMFDLAHKQSAVQITLLRQEGSAGR